MVHDGAALAPGRYWWTVETEGLLVPGTRKGDADFEVVTEEVRRAYRAARAALDASAAPRAADLLRAHLALSHGLYGEAVAPARAALEAHPGDPLARDTLVHVLITLEHPDAETHAPP